MTNHFAENVSLLCKKADISVDQLAKRIGIVPSTLYRHVNPDPEKKEKPAPRTRTVVAVADYFDIPPKALLEEVLSDENLPLIKIKAAEQKEKETTVKAPLVPLVDTEFFFTFGSFIAPLTDPGLRNSKTLSGISAEKWIPAPPFEDLSARDLTAVYVSGNAMFPLLADGDIAYVEMERSEDSPNEFADFQNVKNNDIVLAAPKDLVATLIRRIIVDETGRKWLIKENDNWPGEKMIECREVFGKVVSKAARFG